MTFIRGPLCHGQVAVDVIQDRFWVMFVDPELDVTVTQPSVLEEGKEFLTLPAEHGSDAGAALHWTEYNRAQRRYLDIIERAFGVADPERRGPSLDYIWNGDGRNRNARLTVFRNFDNAMVLAGFVGDIPKTAWVMDFVIFERIYYDLVAGFDVFGSLAHQLATRLYMDHLGMQSENVFLLFLPPERRSDIRASWYAGATHTMSFMRVDRPRGADHGTQVVYRTDDPFSEFLRQAIEVDPRIAGAPDLFNRCANGSCDTGVAERKRDPNAPVLRRLAATRGRALANLPELVLLRVGPAAGEPHRVYTLLHDRAHKNVAYLVDEGARTDPDEDRLTVIEGYAGSYPDFVLDVPGAELGALVDTLTSPTSSSDSNGSEGNFAEAVRRWGVRRADPRFWPVVDWLQTDFEARSPAEATLLDVNRYVDP